MNQHKVHTIEIPSKLKPVLYAYKHNAFDDMGISEFEASKLKLWSSQDKIIEGVKSYNIAFKWLIWSALVTDKGSFFIATDGFHKGSWLLGKFHSMIKDFGFVEKENYILQGMGKVVVLPTGSVIEWVNLEERAGDVDYSVLRGREFTGGITSTYNGLEILEQRLRDKVCPSICKKTIVVDYK